MVFVSLLTRRALVDTGEHLSPKYTPQIIAPPIGSGDRPMDTATLIQIVPIVAEVPKAVPVSTETIQFRRNVRIIIVFGLIKSPAKQTM